MNSMAAFLTQTKLPTMPAPLCSGTSAQLRASKKGKMDETEINKCPVTEREETKHCCLRVVPSLQGQLLLPHSVRQTCTPGEEPKRGSITLLLPSGHVTLGWSNLFQDKHCHCGQVHYSRPVPMAPALTFERERQSLSRILELLVAFQQKVRDKPGKARKN